MTNHNEHAFATRCIHAGQHPDIATGAIMTPVYYSSTYVQDGPGGHKGYEYSRTHNPTRTALEANIASLEQGKYGFATASGCAATAVLLTALDAGDHVVASDDLYGGTYRLFANVFNRHNIAVDFVDLTQPDNLRRAIRPNTKLLWAETPTNPLLKIIDIAAIAEVAHQHKVTLVVDNTFATPALQKPLYLGADIVVHSGTKYLSGHTDVVSGFLVTSDDGWAQRIQYLVNALGPTLSPMDSFLMLRGIKTLAVRMDRHAENAFEIAEFLSGHSAVERVYFPGLKNHPQHSLCIKQMRAPGGMISFVLRGGIEAVKRFMKHTELFSCAESLGGVESLMGHPALMTHASIPVEIRHRLGIVDGLVRLSVGIEDVEDLKRDLSSALTA